MVFQKLVWKKKIINYTGKFFTVIFSIACGLMNAGTLVVLHLLSGFWLYLLAAILFLAVTSMNIKMLGNSVAEVLGLIIGQDRLFQGFLLDKNAFPLSTGKKIACASGIIFALAAGATLGAIVYSNSPSVLLLLIPACAVPPIGIALGCITLICMTALLLNVIVKTLKTEGITEKFKHALKDLVNTDPLLPRNANKSRGRILFERFITLLLTFVAFILAGVALAFTCKAGASVIQKILIAIPNSVNSTVNLISNGIAFGLAMLGQIPFIFKNAFLAVRNVLNWKITVTGLPKPSAKIRAKNMITQLLRIVFAIGNALVSMSGSGNSVVEGLAASGGFFNSMASTQNRKKDSTKNIELEPLTKEKTPLPQNYSGSFFKPAPLSTNNPNLNSEIPNKSNFLLKNS